MATIVEMINPLTGLPEQVDKLDHTAQEIDDAVGLAPQISNPNLLDNWYFGNPVNQRGQTEYTAEGYTIDRWSIGSGATLTLTNGSLYISAGNLITYLESGSNLFSKTVTFSMLTQSGLVSGTARLGDSYAVWDATSLYNGVAFQYRSNDVFALLISKGMFLSGAIAVKLELGSQQTLAHQNADGNWVLNEIPDYGEQLARCQRYFQTFATESLRPTNALDFRPVMRATPALSTITVGGKTLYTASADL